MDIIISSLLYALIIMMCIVGLCALAALIALFVSITIDTLTN